MTHQVRRIEQCSLFNSAYAHALGFDRIICTCGWVSQPDRSHLSLTRMHNDHVLMVERHENALRTASTEDLRAEIARREAAENGRG